MKKLLAITILLEIIILFKMITFGQSNINNTKNCFSIVNFDIVYKYIYSQIIKSNRTFYKYDNYELYVTHKTKISFKNSGYTLSHIIKERGVFALPKNKNDNKKILEKTNQIFCELVLLANK